MTVGGYDVQSKDSIAEDAESSVAQAEAEGRRTGPQILQQAFSPFTSFRLRDVPLTSSEARAWSSAALLTRARRFVTLRGVTMGTPKLRAGTQVELQRVGKPFEGGGYYVTRVCHRFDLDAGYRSYFTAERVGLGANA
jgi:phage protein D